MRHALHEGNAAVAAQQLDDSRAQLQMLESGLREITEVLNAPLLSADPLAER